MVLRMSFVLTLLAVLCRTAHGQHSPKPVFEVRTYTAHPGRLLDMHETFRGYWAKTIFPKHGMTGVIYLAPTDTPSATNKMIYVLQHSSRASADSSWAAFLADPEVQRIAGQRNANGRIVAKVERVFAEPLDFSPIQDFSATTGLVVGRCGESAPSEVRAVCAVNEKWDEANLKMDATIVEPILDEKFFWVSAENLRPKSSIVEILQTTNVRFGVYESYDVDVYISGGMAHVVGMQNRRVRLPEPRDPERWRFTRTFVKRGDRWLILSHHYTKL